jgi:hypothetical protein
MNSPSTNAANATEIVIVFMRSAVRRTASLWRTIASWLIVKISSAAVFTA